MTTQLGSLLGADEDEKEGVVEDGRSEEGVDDDGSIDDNDGNDGKAEDGDGDERSTSAESIASETTISPQTLREAS